MRITVYVLVVILLISCTASKSTPMPNNNIYIIRLKPGMLLKEEIQKFANVQHIQAGWIATCVGSLTEYAIRFANQPEVATGTGFFEIVSLSGTVSENGSHLHIAIADSTGKITGGHLAANSKIYTTAEIVIQYTGKYILKREKDGSTAWEELQIIEKH